MIAYLFELLIRNVELCQELICLLAEVNTGTNLFKAWGLLVINIKGILAQGLDTRTFNHQIVFVTRYLLHHIEYLYKLSFFHSHYFTKLLLVARAYSFNGIRFAPKRRASVGRFF